MMAKTHTAFGNSLALSPVLFSTEFSHFLITNPILGASYMIGIMLGSLLPDIDEPNSKISRLSWLTFLFSWYLLFLGTKHRGFTHKLIIFIVLALFSILSFGDIDQRFSIFFIGLSLGVLFHHLGDMLVGGGERKGGIYDYFWPLGDNWKSFSIFPKILRAKIYSIKEYFYFALFTLLSFYEFTVVLSRFKI